MLNLLTVMKAPACRNGRRGRLKICCGQPRAGSSPAAGINILEKNRLLVGSFFTRVARKIWEKRRSQARFGELLFCSDLASTAITRETR